jgi:hypothetical protein
MQPKVKYLAFALLLYFFSLVYLNYGIQQDAFLETFSVYTFAFIAYLYCIRTRNEFTLKTWLWIAFGAFVIPIFALAPLSPDVYRFLWDGELVTLGIHPYSFTPNELMEANKEVYASGYMQFLYDNCTDLSKGNYTIYPSIHQLYFLLPAFLTDHFYVSLLILRLMMLGTLTLGVLFFIKTLRLLHLPKQHIVLLILNPILIVEVMGNFHFEGIMLAWLMPGIYFLIKKEWLKSSVFWAIAINIKLTPLILLPFLLRYMGVKQSLKFYLVTFLFTTGLLLIYIWPSVFFNFLQSIQLYFDNFEFNAGIFYLTKWVASFFISGNPTLIIGPVLSFLALLSIVFIAFYRPIHSSQLLLNRMMWGYVIYLMLATTVHPWYVILPFGLAVFNANIGLLLWTLLIMLSYGFYAFDSLVWSYTLIGFEYTLVILFLIFPKSKLQNTIRAWLRLESI